MARKLILVTSPPKIERDSLLELSIRRSKHKKHFIVIKFRGNQKKITSLDQAKEVQKETMKKFLLRLDRARKTKKHIIVSLDFYTLSEYGLFPAFTKELVEVISPDMMMFLEDPSRTIVEIPNVGYLKRKNIPALMETRHIQEQNRLLTPLFSGIPMKTIKVSHDNLKQAVKDINYMFDFLLQ